MTTDIDESEIPEWSDERLNRWVAKWLKDKKVKHLTDIDDESEMCGKWRGEFMCECWPDYCGDDAAFGRLVQTMNRAPGVIKIYGPVTGDYEVHYTAADETSVGKGDLKRAHTLCAAKMAARGVEPRGRDE